MPDSLLPPIVALAPGQQATVAAVHRALRAARAHGVASPLVVVVPPGCIHGLLAGVASISGATVHESAYLAPGQAYVVARSLLDDVPELVQADRERAAHYRLVQGGD